MIQLTTAAKLENAIDIANTDEGRDMATECRTSDTRYRC